MPYAGGPKSVHWASLTHHANRQQKIAPADKSSYWARKKLSVNDQKQIAEHVQKKKMAVVPVAPDGGFGWCIVFCACWLHIICCGIMYTIALYIPVFLEDFSLTTSATSWISAVFFASYFGCGPVAGFLVDKFGTQWVAFSGCVIASIGLLIASFASSFYLVIVFFGIVTGVGTGCAVLCAVTSVVRWFEVRRSIAIGLVASGSGVGAAAFAPLLTFLITKYGWSGCMLIESAIALHGCVFALFLRPVPDSNRKCVSHLKPVLKADEANAMPKAKNIMEQNISENRDRFHDDIEVGFVKTAITSADEQEARVKFLKQEGNIRSTNGNGCSGQKSIPSTINDEPKRKLPAFLVIFQDWVFLVFVVSQFLIFFALNTLLVYMVNRALKDCNMDRITASYLVVITGVSSTLGRLVFGALAYKAGEVRFWAFALSMMIVGIATLLVVLGNTFVSAAIYAAVGGLGYGTMICLTSVVLADIFGVSTIAVAYGNLVFFRGLAFLAGPPIGGLIVSLNGGTHTVLFIVMGSIMTVGGALITALPLMRKLKSTVSSKPQ